MNKIYLLPLFCIYMITCYFVQAGDVEAKNPKGDLAREFDFPKNPFFMSQPVFAPPVTNTSYPLK